MTTRSTTGSTTRLALAATALAALALTAGCGSGDHSGMDHSSMTGGASAAASAPAASPAASAATGRAADIAFAQQMIPHHQQAVEMAQIALGKNASQQVKQLATQIKAAQDPEIAVMNTWLTTWGAPTVGPMTDHAAMGHSMPGMMTDADLTTLKSLDGAAFDTKWLQLMIAHHEGALTMANSVLLTTDDAQVKTVAGAIVKGQTAEITAMKSLLS